MSWFGKPKSAKILPLKSSSIRSQSERTERPRNKAETQSFHVRGRSEPNPLVQAISVTSNQEEYSEAEIMEVAKRERDYYVNKIINTLRECHARLNRSTSERQWTRLCERLEDEREFLDKAEVKLAVLTDEDMSVMTKVGIDYTDVGSNKETPLQQVIFDMQVEMEEKKLEHEHAEENRIARKEAMDLFKHIKISQKNLETNLELTKSHDKWEKIPENYQRFSAQTMELIVPQFDELKASLQRKEKLWRRLKDTTLDQKN